MDASGLRGCLEVEGGGFAMLGAGTTVSVIAIFFRAQYVLVLVRCVIGIQSNIQV